MSTNTRGKRPPMPGRLQPTADDIAAMIRVDHAGEFGALRIYEGQLAVLGQQASPGAVAIRQMAEQEQSHFDVFDRIVGAHMNIAPQRNALAAAVPIKRATPADAARIAPIFAAAFGADPVFDWLARGGKKRERALERFFLWVLDRTIAHGETWLD